MIIREINIEEIDKAVNVLNHVPEFDSLFYSVAIREKLKGKETIILLAEYAGKPVACKIAYNRFFDGSIYSWLGGVLPPYRNQCIAKGLLDELEALAQKRFFTSIRFKTRNRHVGMLQFALKNGFMITGFEGREPKTESRIMLEKSFKKALYA